MRQTAIGVVALLVLILGIGIGAYQRGLRDGQRFVRDEWVGSSVVMQAPNPDQFGRAFCIVADRLWSARSDGMCYVEDMPR